MRPSCRKGYFAVVPTSADYPEALKVAGSPLVLFGAGNRDLIGKRKFCIVGSRITPPWAERMGTRIAGELAERFAVVTGLAEGGNLAAIRGAFGSGNLISVLPCGIGMLSRCSCLPERGDRKKGADPFGVPAR